MRIVIPEYSCGTFNDGSAVLDGSERQMIFLSGPAFYIPLGQGL